MKGLSLNSPVAGLKPNLPIVTQWRQSQGPGKQINLGYRLRAPVYLNRGTIAAHYNTPSHKMSV